MSDQKTGIEPTDENAVEYDSNATPPSGDPSKQHASRTQITICRGQPTPAGWVIVGYVRNYPNCPFWPDASNTNAVIIQKL